MEKTRNKKTKTNRQMRWNMTRNKREPEKSESEPRIGKRRTTTGSSLSNSWRRARQWKLRNQRSRPRRRMITRRVVGIPLNNAMQPAFVSFYFSFILLLKIKRNERKEKNEEIPIPILFIIIPFGALKYHHHHHRWLNMSPTHSIHSVEIPLLSINIDNAAKDNRIWSGVWEV